MKKTTLIALSVCVLLAAFYLATRENRVSVGVKQLALNKIIPEQIDSMTISGKEKLSLSKHDGLWFVSSAAVEGKIFPANPTTVVEFLSGAQELSSSELVSERKDKHEYYEVDPVKGVRLELSSQGKPIWGIIVGKYSDAGRFVKALNSDDIYSAKAQFYKLMKQDLKDWRDKAITGAKTDEIKKVVVEHAKGPMVSLYYKDSEKTWMLTDLPANFRFDQNKANHFVSSFAQLNAKEFVENQGDKDRVAKLFAQDSLKISAETNSNPITIILTEDASSKTGYAKRADSEQLYEIPYYTYKDLALNLEGFRDLKVVDFDPTTIKKVTFETNKEKTVLEKKNDSWVIISPNKLPKDFAFDEERVLANLKNINALKAERLVSIKPEAASLRNAQGIRMIELVDAQGTVKRIEFGKKVNDEIYVKSAIDNAIYAFNSKNLEQFSKGIELFKKNSRSELDNLPLETRKQIEEALRKMGKSKENV